MIYNIFRFWLPQTEFFKRSPLLVLLSQKYALLQSSDRIINITTLKCVVVIKDVSIHRSTSSSSYLNNVKRHNNPFLGPNVPAGDPYGISPFLASQRVPAIGLHGFVHIPPILDNVSGTICNTSP